jgi:cytochrome c oxidase cbb3-type subunit 3
MAVIGYLRMNAPVAPGMAKLPLPGNATAGLSLFLRNCVGCHGMNGRGGMAPEIGNPVFQQAASDEFIIRTIRNGRMGTAMPAFQRTDAPALTDQDLADILAYLRTLGVQKGRRAMAQNASTPSGGRP